MKKLLITLCVIVLSVVAAIPLFACVARLSPSVPHPPPSVEQPPPSVQQPPSSDVNAASQARAALRVQTDFIYESYQNLFDTSRQNGGFVVAQAASASIAQSTQDLNSVQNLVPTLQDVKYLFTSRGLNIGNRVAGDFFTTEIFLYSQIQLSLKEAYDYKMLAREFDLTYTVCDDYILFFNPMPEGWQPSQPPFHWPMFVPHKASIAGVCGDTDRIYTVVTGMEFGFSRMANQLLVQTGHNSFFFNNENDFQLLSLTKRHTLDGELREMGFCIHDAATNTYIEVQFRYNAQGVMVPFMVQYNNAFIQVGQLSTDEHQLLFNFVSTQMQAMQYRISSLEQSNLELVEVASQTEQVSDDDLQEYTPQTPHLVNIDFDILRMMLGA